MTTVPPVLTLPPRWIVLVSFVRLSVVLLLCVTGTPVWALPLWSALVLPFSGIGLRVMPLLFFAGTTLSSLITVFGPRALWLFPSGAPRGISVNYRPIPLLCGSPSSS